jgi:hypothetical protein
VIVYHEGPLSTAESKWVERLESQTIDHGGFANAKVIRVAMAENVAVDGDVADRDTAKMRELVKALDGLDKVVFPYVVARTKIGGKRMVNHWRGSLDDFSRVDVIRSPVRKELRRRLLSGDSVVWLMLRSSDRQRNDATRARMESDLEELATAVSLPEGVGLPGSELHSEVPLLVRFSLLEIDPADPREQFLVDLFRGFYPDLARDGEPLLVPVFGRGRALEVIPADDLDSNLTRDLSLFLAGACSCQVKEQNPGFDLLIEADWDSELFGAEGVRPPPAKTVSDRTAPPVLLSIPPGRNR